LNEILVTCWKLGKGGLARMGGREKRKNGLELNEIWHKEPKPNKK